MKRRICFSENRSIARMRRWTKNALLEKHAETLTWRAAEARYAQWRQTPEYQKELSRMQEIARRIREDFGEDFEFYERE